MNAVRDVNDTGAAAPVGWPLGVLLVRAGRMTELDVSRVLVAQREQNVQFGVAAQRLGLVTQEDVQRALALQFGYAYPPVDDCGPEAEAMRTLRGQLMLQCAAGQKKIVALLSPHSAEDASFLAGNLAIAFAQLDRHTLLIDANLRNPTQHTRFGIAGREGLSSVLARGIPFLESLARVTSLANLAILPAGPIPPNPHELLSSDRFTDLLDTAKSRFDCIIVDTSPLLETTDGQMVAARAGSCVVVVRRQEQVANIERVKTLIKAAGANLIGAVLR
jgi:protein-tyrosine kinase